jgi:hypothetical protein
LHLLESSYSEKSIVSWFSFLQIALLSLLVVLAQLLVQADLQGVLDEVFFLLREIYSYSLTLI